MSLSEDDIGLLCAGFTIILGFQVVPPRQIGGQEFSQSACLSLESATGPSRRSVLPKIGVHEVFHTTYGPFVPLLPQPQSRLALESAQVPLDSFDINVKILNGETTTVRATKGQTVKDVKATIERQLGIPFQYKKLTLFGQPMIDTQPIDMYMSRKAGHLRLEMLQSPSFQTPVMCCVGGEEGPYELDCSDLDPRFNYDFTNEDDDGKKYVRGGKVYNRPYGWKRIAVKVLDDERYNKNNTWLGEDGIRTNESQGEWPVSYHGARTKDAVDKIIHKGYKIGQGDMYGAGVYTSPSIKWYGKKGNQYTATFYYKGKEWMIILQNRVNPDPGHLIIKEETWAGVPFWISPLQDVKNKVFDVRPYGVLFKKA